MTLHAQQRARRAAAEPWGMDAPTLESPGSSKAVPLHIADGTLEALKWLALLLMMADHLNTFIWQRESRLVFELGRLSMPLFAFVLAYNLARPDGPAGGALQRTIWRLLFYGALSTPMFAMLAGWWPLNILFTFALASLVLVLVRSGGGVAAMAAAAIFIAGGALVEYMWFGAGVVLAAWAYCREPTGWRLGVLSMALASLAVVNGTPTALLALPIVFLVLRLRIPVPRLRGLFYVLYPVHLGLIALAK